MNAKKLSAILTLEDNSTVVFDIPIVITQPVPTPTPPQNKKHILLNCINWAPLANLPLSSASEFTYFILPVNADGSLTGASPTLETKFVKDVHAAGKKATFSIGGGSQNTNLISTAITQKINLVNAINDHINAWGYDGVTLDIENTSLNPQVIVDFINALRIKIGNDKIIGCYTQPYQLNTVWSKVDQVINSITWLAPMVYDFPNAVAEFKTLTALWLAKVPKEKLLAGAAVNYDATGLDLNEFPQILEWVNTQGLGGVGIWNNQLYTQPYQDLVKQKLNF